MDILKTFKNKLILHKALSLFVCAVMILSVFTVSIVARADSTNVWDGSEASSFAGGEGTKNSPWLIENGAQLYHMVKVYGNVSADTANSSNMPYFKITKDIYLNNVTDADMASPTAADWKAKGFKSWFSTAETKAGFYGELDGNGHTVYGLFTDGTAGSMYNAGLIPSVIGKAKITNVNLKNSFVYGKNAGCIVGKVYGSSAELTVNGCSSDNCYIQCWGSGYRLGGIVGGGEASPKTITITNCSATNLTFNNPCEYNSSASGKMPGVQSGMLGFVGSGSHVVSNCYTDATTHPVAAGDTNDLNTNGVQVFKRVGDYVTYTNVYTAADCPIAKAGVTKLTADQMKGEAAKTNMTGFDFEKVWQTVENGYPVINLREPTSKEIWDGTKASSFADGEGTKEKPYEIENGAQLYKMVAENSATAYADLSTATPKYFKITKDIYLNDVAAADMQAAVTAAADSTDGNVASWNTKNFNKWYTHSAQKSGFYGVVDGGGHTIYGLYVNGGTYSGLIGNAVGNTKISDLKLQNSYVYGKCVGGIVGSAYGANTTLTVSYCSTDNVVVECKGGSDKGVRVAGIVGGGESTGKITLENCSTTNSTIKSHHSTYPGIESGLLGYIGSAGQGHEVKNCFVDDSAHPLSNATNSAHFETNMGANVTYSNVYYIRREADSTRNFLSTSTVEKQFTVLTADKMKGEAAKTNMSGLDFDTVWQTVENGYPVINLREPTSKEIWDGSKDFELEGDGSESNPFLIKTPAQLAAVVTGSNSGKFTGKNFKLTNDIVINDTSKANWKDNARNWVWEDFRFVGTFDGDGHTIDGLYFNGSQKRFGLFSYVGDSLIKNLKISNAYINNTFTSSNADAEGMGIICAQASAKADFEYIYIDATCSINAPNIKGVAGIVGRSNQEVNISNCAVLGTYNGKSHVSSFLGTFWNGTQTISNSYSAANVPVTTSRTPVVTNTYATVKTADNY